MDINGIDAGDRRPAALPDGSLLIPLGEAVERLTPDGRLAIAAGQGTECAGVQCPDPPSGDGGPATQAGMSAPVAVAAVPGGGFLIADESAAVIRRVDAQGIIATVAGGHEAATDHRDPIGINGPATRASLVRPDAVAVVPDGRFFIADGSWILRADPDGILRAAAHLPGWDITEIAAQDDGGVLILAAAPSPSSRSRLQRLTPDGHLAAPTRVPFAARGLVALPDGTALTIDTSGRRVVQIAFDGTVRVVLPERAFRDFAGREPGLDESQAITFTGLAMSGEGLFIATNAAILLAPINPASRTLARIRRAHTTGRTPRLQIQTTRPGTMELQLLNGADPEPVLARSVQAVDAGTHWLPIPGERRRGLLRVNAQLTADDGVAADSVTLLLGPTLPVAVVPELLNKEEYTYRPCRRMSARRVDCSSGTAGTSDQCLDMVAVVAGADGVLRGRYYPCQDDHAHFRSHPRWEGHSFVITA